MFLTHSLNCTDLLEQVILFLKSTKRIINGFIKELESLSGICIVIRIQTKCVQSHCPTPFPTKWATKLDSRFESKMQNLWFRKHCACNTKVADLNSILEKNIYLKWVLQNTQLW